MPSFESSRSARRKTSYVDDYSYTKMIALFNKTDGKNVAEKSHRVSVTLKTDISYEHALKSVKDDTYQKMAGTDLSNLFMPFQTVAGSGNLPCLDPSFDKLKPESGINGKSLMPFYYDNTKKDIVYDRWNSPSGDTLNYLVSSDKIYGDINRYRDISNTRGIGIRLPAVGVGWGYTLDGRPYPSGSSSKKFKGEYSRGQDVDPADYIAAPIDLRYDLERNVWTTYATGFWAQITDSSGYKINDNSFPDVSGTLYSWIELSLDPSGYFHKKTNGRSGTFTDKPAYEINNIKSFQSDNVWLNYNSQYDYYIFQKPIVKGTKYQVLMVVDDGNNTVVWDYPRFH